MTEFKYGILCEDTAHRVFVQHSLSCIAQSINDTYTISVLDKLPVEANSKSEVDNYCHRFSSEVFRQMYRADFLVICRDIDSIDVKVYRKKEAELAGKLHHTAKNRSILCLPVQCIEHWLLYLKQHQEEPLLTKNESVETKPRRDAKFLVYGRTKINKELCHEVVSSHCSDMDITWLESRSKSFLEFAKNARVVFQYLASIPSSTT